jgi:hypothetical protein
MTDQSSDSLIDYDNSIAKLNKQIDDLTQQKSDRMRILADPERRDIYTAYATIARCIDKLDTLGENVSASGNVAIEIYGKTFSYINGVIKENNV